MRTTLFTSGNVDFINTEMYWPVNHMSGRENP
jgi:hypothetical protein